MRKIGLAASLGFAILVQPAAAQITKAPAPSEASRIGVETAAKGLANPWSFQFLPDGRMMVNEIRGTMRIVEKDGSISSPIAGVPQVQATGQGGLLDLALAPDHATSGTLYFTFSEPRGGGLVGTSLARGKLALEAGRARLDGVAVIFRQKPDYHAPMHFGSRIAFSPQGGLFVTLGERNTGREIGSLNQQQAQNPASHFGKVVRLNPDGTAHAATPKLPGWAPEVWSIGHRNPQAAAINPATGNLWTVEHGARGGDEINIPQAGKNYGWPVISYGRDYSGAKIGIGTEKPGMEQPIYYWDPSIAPSGMAFYTGSLFPAWKGNLFVGALAGSHLARLVIEGNKVVAEEKLLASERDRIRDVRQGPDGALYVATDSGRGRILRIAPGK
ncbi:unnamed protein product [Phaeothamnion confervicola]